MALDLVHQTKSEFAERFWLRLREEYDADNKLMYHKMIHWLWSRIQDGDITNEQARTTYNSTFGKTLDATEWSNLVTTRFVPIKDRYVAFLAELDVWL